MSNLYDTTTREEREPGAGIRRDMVNELERGGELAVDFYRDLVHHATCVLYGVKSEITRHLFLREIGASHGEDSGPGAFGETI